MKIKAYKVIPKYPKESNVMKIVFSRKELSQKLKFKPENVENTTPMHETESSTGILLDRTPFKRTIDEKEYNADDSEYEVTGVLISHPFDVTTPTSLHELSATENSETTNAASSNDETSDVGARHATAVAVVSGSGSPTVIALSNGSVVVSNTGSETNVHTESTTKKIATATKKTAIAIETIETAPEKIASTTEKVTTTATPEATTLNSVTVAQTTTSAPDVTTTSAPTHSTPYAEVTFVDVEVVATHSGPSKEVVVEDDVPLPSDRSVMSPNTGYESSANTASTTEKIASSSSTSESAPDFIVCTAPKQGTPQADTATTEVTSANLVTPSITSATTASQITSHTSREEEVGVPYDNASSSSSDSASVSGESVVSTEDDKPEIDPENTDAEIISDERTAAFLPTTATDSTPFLLRATTIPVPMTTTEPISQSEDVATPRNTLNIFDGGRVFVFGPILGRSAPNTSPSPFPKNYDQATTGKHLNKPLLKHIFKFVAKHPLAKTLFTTRPHNSERNANGNMLSTIWNFNVPLIDGKKIHKRETEFLVTPSPRRPKSSRKSIIDRLHEETSIERAERRHKTVEKLMHVATIAGHFDNYLTRHLKNGVKTLHKIFNSEEDTRSRL